MLCTIWYAFKKLSLRQSLCSMISIFASKLLGVVSVILSSNSSSKRKVSTLIEFISEIVWDCPWLSLNVPDYPWFINVVISIFANKLLGVVSVILSSNSSSKSKVSTLVELCVPYSHLGFLWVCKCPSLSLSVNIINN